MVNRFWPYMNSLPTQSLTEEQLFRPSMDCIVLTLHSFRDTKAVLFMVNYIFHQFDIFLCDLHFNSVLSFIHFQLNLYILPIRFYFSFAIKV